MDDKLAWRKLLGMSRVARLVGLGIATALLSACVSAAPDLSDYGDFRPADWQVAEPVTANSMYVVVDVVSRGCVLADPVAKTSVSYGGDNITITASVAQKDRQGCQLTIAFTGVFRCGVQ